LDSPLKLSKTIGKNILFAWRDLQGYHAKYKQEIEKETAQKINTNHNEQQGKRLI